MSFGYNFVVMVLRSERFLLSGSIGRLQRIRFFGRTHVYASPNALRHAEVFCVADRIDQLERPVRRCALGLGPTLVIASLRGRRVTGVDHRRAACGLAAGSTPLISVRPSVRPAGITAIPTRGRVAGIMVRAYTTRAITPAFE